MNLKQGDTAPKVQGALTSGPTNTPVNVTGATVLFRLMKLNGTFVMSKTASVTDAVNGLVEYQWVSGDLALLLPGAYRAEFVVTFADTRVERFPQRSYLEVIVRPAV